MVAWCNHRLRIRIYVVDLEEDDPRKCTARKMVEHGFACRVRRPPRGSIVLDPYADVPLSPLDSRHVAENGVTVVDASWNRLTSERFARITSRWRGVVRRRLPILLAANPPHYARIFQLSSLEAVAAALYITGFREEASEVLSLYKWGESFIELNKMLLEAYAASTSPEEILEIEAEFLGKVLERRVSRDEVPRILRLLAENVNT